ncbi:hypothetical protein SAMN06265218_10984 [Fodinibius sediminis]|uniref:Uncharacterized protein n=1 Tax=Fodinibius sediminis TaxID=1214077 RepID=A0A521DAA7_9BACT|nr:hypothetical protein SAMN06265218_10984 [Fodinibius sediminis]
MVGSLTGHTIFFGDWARPVNIYQAEQYCFSFEHNPLLLELEINLSSFCCGLRIKKWKEFIATTASSNSVYRS